MKSGTPSPSASSSTLAGTVVLRRVKLTVMGVTPDRGLASKVIPGPGVAASVIVWVAVAPVVVVATAVTSVLARRGITAAKLVPCTAAGMPLTVTPASAPAASMVPRTSSWPAGTVAPSTGSVIVTWSPAVTVIVMVSDACPPKPAATVKPSVWPTLTILSPIGSKTGGWLGRGVTVTFTDAVLFARPSVTWSWKVRTVSAVTTGAVKPAVAEPALRRVTAGPAGWGQAKVSGSPSGSKL